MKKGLILCLALVMAFAMVANAAKISRNLVTKDGEAPVVKAPGAKLPSIGTIISTTGYSDAWRSTAASPGKSIVVDPTGTNMAVVFGRKPTSGSGCDMIFGFSNDGGATWSTTTLANNLNVRIYNGVALDDAGNPYVCWQDRAKNSIQWMRDDGGIGGGLWGTPDTFARDSVAWYIPGFAVKGNKLIASAFSHGAAAPVGDFSIHMAMSNDLGASWQAPWDRLPLPYGWNKFCYNEINGQGWDLDEADWLISGSGDTVLAYLDLVGDTLMSMADPYSSFFPAYKISYDGGITWQAMQMFLPMPQYWYGGWWYMYDGAWIGDRPYLLYTWQDGTWNGNALFVYFPTNAGDYSAWTCKRISDIPGNLSGATPGSLNGGGVNFPTISSDAAGNIYAIYNDYSRTADSYEIFGVASTDGGNTWLNPVQLSNQAPEFDGNYYLEAAEYAADDKIHMIFHDPAYTNMYYWSVPTSTILAGTARPEEITLAPELCGLAEGGWGGPIDATMDTMAAAGDTFMTFWAPKVAFGGTYLVNVSTKPDFSDSVYHWTGSVLDVNYLMTIGFPYANTVLYWRVRSEKAGEHSPWSAVYDFYYNGTTINTTDWTGGTGVEGTPTTAPETKMVLNQSRPNPVRENTVISFNLPKSGNYSLKIYNIAGQVVRTLDGKGNAGLNKVTWNGMDDNGRKVANGIYLYNLKAFGNSATKKLVVVR